MKNQSSVKRLHKSFEPDNIDTWRKGSKLYFECPIKRPVVKYYEIDTRNDSCTAVVRKSHSIYFEIAAVLILAAMVYIFLTMPQRTQEVQIPETLLASDGYLSINVNNAEDNHPITLVFKYENKMLIDAIDLKPGESIGAVDQAINLPNGTYMIDIDYKINSPIKSWTHTYQAMLTVDYGKSNDAEGNIEVEATIPPTEDIEPPVSTKTTDEGIDGIVPEKPIIPEDNRTNPSTSDTSTNPATIE